MTYDKTLELDRMVLASGIAAFTSLGYFAWYIVLRFVVQVVAVVVVYS